MSDPAEVKENRFIRSSTHHLEAGFVKVDVRHYEFERDQLIVIVVISGGIDMNDPWQCGVFTNFIARIMTPGKRIFESTFSPVALNSQAEGFRATYWPR